MTDALNEIIEENLGDEPGVEIDEGSDKEELDELSLLKSEIDSLRQELRTRDEREQANSRMLNELTEFSEYFPDVDIHHIPSEVWEQVKNGTSISAAFALNLRKIELEKKKVSDFNDKNRRISAGSLLGGEGEKYYSPAEVKRMTPAQVKSHYDDIIESMRHWN
jgi:hypothetical protein